MGHKTDMKRYAPTPARKSPRPRVAASPRPASPEEQLCRDRLGTLTVADPAYPSPRAWLVAQF